MRICFAIIFCLLFTFCTSPQRQDTPTPKTRISIEGDNFLINGKPTLEGSRLERN
jgi:hypothetical protein